jgi:hypothetical protein
LLAGAGLLCPKRSILANEDGSPKRRYKTIVPYSISHSPEHQLEFAGAIALGLCFVGISETGANKSDFGSGTYPVRQKG